MSLGHPKDCRCISCQYVRRTEAKASGSHQRAGSVLPKPSSDQLVKKLMRKVNARRAAHRKHSIEGMKRGWNYVAPE